MPELFDSWVIESALSNPHVSLKGKKTVRDAVKIDVSKVADLDPRSMGYRILTPRRTPNGFGQETLLEGALRGYAALGGKGSKVIDDAFDFKQKQVSIAMIGNILKAPRRKCADWTVASGLGASAGAAAVYGASGGVYFWNKPTSGELGLYGSVSLGMMTNIGASATWQVSYLFGPAPALLAGESIIVGVELGGQVFTGGGYLIFSYSWPTELIGISFALGVGASALPANITVQYSKTWIKPAIAV